MKQILIVMFFTWSIQVCYGIKPDSTYHSTPDALGLIYQTNRIATSDSKAELNSWMVKADSNIENGTTLILCYGDSGNMSYWLNQAGILSQVGYDVLLFDYRGFGNSSSFAIDPDQLYYDEFATDLKTVISWAKRNLQFKNLGVISFSMGTIVSTIALQTEKVDFLIGEGFVLDPMEIKNKVLKLKGKEIILPGSSDGYLQMVSNLKLPILLFSGIKDEFTTTMDSEKVINMSENRTLVKFEGNHLEGFTKLSGKYYGEGYLESINHFLVKEIK
nr:alpha/beta fold hydrolase [uncultured Brumimicrobium sp.]